MTGQVKEEVLTRFVELGIEVKEEAIRIQPTLLRKQEFLTQATTFSCLALSGEKRSYVLEAGQLAFTYCQVPFIYQISEQAQGHIEVMMNDDSVQLFDQLELDRNISQAIFARTGEVEKVLVSIPESMLYRG